ncbi:uncharacterized protein LOC121257814 [Juglans microcarpa x Juglans regia]|uniref:uncharacterized protein LOC121257814 n=1 Tax=Juglans microcarpa x Juglans regia TaxID=2249226 RepID=UPI001B7EE974|nr:uncharacterized protein LOC121257814 [Juglans microcarpa x Juglans regia]
MEEFLTPTLCNPRLIYVIYSSSSDLASVRIFSSPIYLHESGYVLRPDSSSMLRGPITGAAVSSWTNNSMQTINILHRTKVPIVANNCCFPYDINLCCSGTLSPS